MIKSQVVRPSIPVRKPFKAPRRSLVRYFYREEVRDSSWIVLLTNENGNRATVVHVQGTNDNVGTIWSEPTFTNACKCQRGYMELFDGEISLSNDD